MIPSSTLLDVSDFFVPHRILTSPVSIHAPAWGATGRRSLCRGHRSVSTHAPTRGATRTFEKPTKANLFQSTLPHGERRISVAVRTLCRRFNPRSQMGSDAQEVFHQQRGDVSIHAPAWGATTLHGVELNRIKVSTHAPAWGATVPCLA